MRGDRKRWGTTTVESAITLAVLATIVIAILDLGVALYRRHAISYAVRHASRSASVHGSQASLLGSWGPATVGPVTVNTSGPITDEIRPHLCGLDPSRVTMRLEWPDGDNAPGSRVRVTLEMTHRPVLSWLFGSDPIPLRATSTTPISH